MFNKKKILDNLSLLVIVLFHPLFSLIGYLLLAFYKTNFTTSEYFLLVPPFLVMLVILPFIYLDNYSHSKYKPLIIDLKDQKLFLTFLSFCFTFFLLILAWLKIDSLYSQKVLALFILTLFLTGINFYRKFNLEVPYFTALVSFMLMEAENLLIFSLLLFGPLVWAQLRLKRLSARQLILSVILAFLIISGTIRI